LIKKFNFDPDPERILKYLSKGFGSGIPFKVGSGNNLFGSDELFLNSFQSEVGGRRGEVGRSAVPLGHGEEWV